jgi:hypothetical protein
LKLKGSTGHLSKNGCQQRRTSRNLIKCSIFRLYTSYLGNTSNPVPLESVFMGAIFHNYKQLLQITKDEDITIDEDSLKEELVSLLENKPEGEILFYRYSKRGMVLCTFFIKKIDCFC